MSLPTLDFVPLAEDVAGAVARVPVAPGVGQILGPGERSLLLGTASNLRRWAASHLGLGKPRAPGRRPKTNLAGIATAVGWAEADGPFRQRLLYERLVAPLVPLSTRRDLKPPVFRHHDPADRVPRVTARGADEGAAGLFGPFRDRRAADRAKDALLRLFPLRPCDYAFEPDPALPLGLGCVYAQVRSCAAPCLCRAGEDEYRALAASASAWLADPLARADAPAAVPAPVGAALTARALVVDPGRAEVGLFPLLGGRVLEARVRWTAADALERALADLEWSEAAAPDAAPGASDWPWLTSWLRAPKARAAYLVVREGEPRASLAARAAAVVVTPAGAPRVGGKVRATRGRD